MEQSKGNLEQLQRLMRRLVLGSFAVTTVVLVCVATLGG